MLVKVKPGIYVNTNYIARLTKDTKHLAVDSTDEWILTQSIGNITSHLAVSSIAVAHLLSLMEADSSAILPGEDNFLTENRKTKTENARPLTSRIAELLRDEYPQGASVEELTKKLNARYDKIYDAISDLLAERVAVFDPARPLRYYHYQHRPDKTAPEPEINLLDLTTGLDDIFAAANTARSKLETENNANFLMVNALRQGELQCIECQHQSCATCVTAKACCKCNQPAFTAYVAPLHTYDIKSAYPSDLPKQLLAPCCKGPANAIFFDNGVVWCHACSAIWNPSECLMESSSTLDPSIVNAEWE